MHPLTLQKLRLHDTATERVAQRVIANTEMRGECLVWLRATDRDGYGVTYYQHRQFRVSRFVYLAWVADPFSAFVLHTCDNPPCCLPGHLFPGDAGINRRDSRDKGRLLMPKGEECSWAKLDEETVRLIRENYRWRVPGCTALALAEKFNVGLGSVWAALRGETWKHLK